MSPQSCCDEYAALTRRGLLRGALALAGTTTVLGSAVVTASPAAAAAADPRSARSVLVVLSLRGAADGLSLVVPHADPVYYAARPRIAVPAERLLAKDATFGLHPELAPLLQAWRRIATQRRGQADPRLEEFRWLLEELRVSLFAQELRTPTPVSVKRLQKALEGLRG